MKRGLSGFVWAFILGAVLLFWSTSSHSADKPDVLEIISIDGVIDDGMATSLTRKVDEINENKRVKAVLLIVDSPGGGVLASSAIYEELAKLKVPVVGWCNNLCASGGMYILMAPTVKYIGVRSSTISGSIGVIMTITRFNRLLDWAKIDNETYKSGGLKDAGNPTHALEEAERAYLQGTVDSLAQRFYALVAHSRGGKITQWDAIKSARIFIGDEGVKVGLVDEVMGLEQVVKKAKSLSGSSLIFTRDEMKKLSKDADGASSYGYELPLPQARAPYGDLPWLIETLKEIRAGDSVHIEYRLRYTL